MDPTSKQPPLRKVTFNITGELRARPTDYHGKQYDQTPRLNATTMATDEMSRAILGNRGKLLTTPRPMEAGLSPMRRSCLAPLSGLGGTSPVPSELTVWVKKEMDDLKPHYLELSFGESFKDIKLNLFFEAEKEKLERLEDVGGAIGVLFRGLNRMLTLSSIDKAKCRKFCSDFEKIIQKLNDSSSKITRICNGLDDEDSDKDLLITRLRAICQRIVTLSKGSHLLNQYLEAEVSPEGSLMKLREEGSSSSQSLTRSASSLDGNSSPCGLLSSAMPAPKEDVEGSDSVPIVAPRRRVPVAPGQIGELQFLARITKGLSDGLSTTIMQTAESQLGAVNSSDCLVVTDL